jgi:peptide/nickel transport system ATP-binding protein
MSRSILFSGVNVRYGNQTVLDLPHLRMESGEVTVVAGPSGSGKSTLGHAAAGLLSYMGARIRGEMSIGDVTASLNDRRAMQTLRGWAVRWIPQEPARGFTLTRPVLPQMLEGVEHSGAIREKLDRLLKVLGLPPSARLENLYPFEMSGGMLQRAAVISAFLPGPELVVADEPSAHLDSASTIVLGRIITTIARTTSVSVMWITHDLRLAAAVADRILFLEDGLVLAEGEPSELLDPNREGRPKLVAASARLAMPT